MHLRGSDKFRFHILDTEIARSPEQTVRRTPMATTLDISDAICVSQNEDNARQSAWATSADWGRHRTLIARLYQENPLSKVM